MKPVTDSLLNRFGADYEASAERHLATLALSKSELSSVAFSSKGANAMRQKFSVEVPTLEVTNQKSSGRCWLFAATNVLRERIAQMGIELVERPLASPSGDFARHDPDALASAVLDIYRARAVHIYGGRESYRIEK